MDKADRIRIALVEDDDILSSLYDEALCMMGFSVGIAKTGQEALRIVEENNPHLVILDIVMPDGDGFFVLKKLKDDPKTRNIPVIIHTNLFSESDKAEALRLGAKEYVVKTEVTPKQLAEIVKKYVA